MRNGRSIRVVGVIVALGACSDPTGTPWTSPNLQVVQGHGVLLLTQNLVPNDAMAALFEGPVIADDAGCIRLDGPDDATVVWPHGFTAEPTIEGVEIHDGSGDRVGRLGDPFSLAGGEVATLHDGMGFTEEDRELASQHCPGRYWIVS